MGAAFATRYLCGNVILQMWAIANKSSTSLKLYTMNFFGKLVPKNVRLSDLEKPNMEQSHPFMKVKISDTMYCIFLFCVLADYYFYHLRYGKIWYYFAPPTFSANNDRQIKYFNGGSGFLF